jgi:methylmalonyl-CoA mutase N-terminal domain/subunit
MTDEMDRQAEEVFAHPEELGDGSMLEGVYAAIDNGYFVDEIADAAYRFERALNDGDRVIVGVNDFTEGNADQAFPELLRIGADTEEQQLERLSKVKRHRGDAYLPALERIRKDAADPTVNLMPAIVDAVKAYATLGEIIQTLEAEFGTWTEPARA